MVTTRCEVIPVAGSCGAEVRGVDLARLDDAGFAEIRSAFLEHAVLFFRNQELSPAQQKAFAARFGPLDVHPIVEGMEEHPEVVRVLKPEGESASFGTGWHSDNSFFERPSLGSILYALEVPPYGGDTLFASMEKAYDALSRPMKDFLADKVAVHSAELAYDPAVTGKEKYEGKAAIKYRYSDAIHERHEHPVIRTHRDTGRKSIYVNPMFTREIVGLERSESDAVLGFLYSHATKVDFTCRFRWRAGSVAVWDNRCLQHYAMDDYQPFRRLMHRVTVGGERPV